MLFSQLMVMRRMRKNKGKPAPRLSGDAGKAVNEGKAVLFYFYSPSCHACRSMTPKIDKIKEQYPYVFKIDASTNISMAQNFNVMGTPTTILVKDGIIKEILVGAQSDKKLVSLFEEV